MPLGLTQSGYYSGMDKSFDERLKDNKIRQMAAAQGKTVKVFLEDRDHFKELADIDSETKAYEAEDAAAEEQSVIDVNNAMMDQEYDKRVVGDKERNQHGLDPERFKRRGQEGVPISELISNQQGRQANQAERRKWEMEKLGIGDPDDPAETGHMINEILPGLHKSRYLGPGSNTREDVAGENELDRMSRLRAGQDVAESGFLGEETFQPTFKSERIEQGKQAAEDDFLEEEAPPWEENPVNPAVQAQLAQEKLDEPGGMLDDLRAETQAGEFGDAGRDEENPAVKDFKEMNKKAAAGDQDAKAARAEMFPPDMDKKEKAMLKEELGNYYIGPGGYAYNIDVMEADDKRYANMELMQHMPAHQRPHMMCKLGYIDPEDCKNMPESDLVKTEEMKMATKIAVNEMKEKEATKRTRITAETSVTTTGMTTKTREIIAKGAYGSAENVAKIGALSNEKITGMGLNFKELERKSLDLIAMNDVEARKYIADEQNKVSYNKIDEHTKNLTSQLNSNENISKWGIDANKFMNTENAVLARDLKAVDKNITEAQIQATKDNLTTQLNSDATLKEMGIDGAKFLQGDAQEHQKWIKTQQGKIDMATINMTKDHFKKQIAFNYKQLEGVERFKGAQLAQMGATQLMEFKLKSTAQQQAEILNKHKMGMGRLKVLTSNGQVEAAMYQAKAMGMPWATDIKAFWKSRLKDASIDNKDAIAAFEKAGYSSSLGNLKSGMNEYLNAKGEYYDDFMSEAVNKDSGLKPIEAFVANNQNSINFRDDPLGPAWSNMSGEQQKEWNENKGGYAGWKATMVQKAVNYKIRLHPNFKEVATAFQNKDLKDRMNADKSKTGPPPPKTPDETVKTKTKTKTKPSTPEGPKTTYGSQMQDILKDVYASRKKQIGMKSPGKTPKFKPETLVNKEEMRKASLAEGKKDLETEVGTKVKGKLKYGGTLGKALEHFSQYPQDLKRLKNLDLKHYIMNELNKREVQGKTGF